MARYEFLVEAGGRLRGEARVPGDKSVSHRSAILGAIASGRTQIEGYLQGHDTLATLNAMAQLGVSVSGPDAHGSVTIDGVGLDGLTPSAVPLDLGNSGTAMRLLPGVLAGQSFLTTLVGDESLSGRPMRRIADPLTEMGAAIATTAGGTPPLQVGGQAPLRAIDYHMPVASAQVKSCLLLAAQYATGVTRIVEPAPSRDHTERMLRGFGATVETSGNIIAFEGRQLLRGTRVVVPADLSSAAFLMVGAAIAPGSDVLLPGVGINPTRTGVLEILREMGANIEVRDAREEAGEPVADLHVTDGALRGIDIPAELVPLAIDEFPAIFIAAACAKGVTTLTGAAELRVKESDRIGVMAEGLQRIGINAQVRDDGIRIEGGEIDGGTVNSHGDHRIAMSFAMAGLRAQKAIRIQDCANVQTSFPGFKDLVQRLGSPLQSVIVSNEAD